MEGGFEGFGGAGRGGGGFVWWFRAESCLSVCHRLCAAHSVEKIIIKLSLILPNVDLTSQIEGLCGDEGADFTP